MKTFTTPQWYLIPEARILRRTEFPPRSPRRRSQCTAWLRRHKLVSPALPTGGLCGSQEARGSAPTHVCLHLLPLMVTDKAAGLPRTVPLVPSARLASLRMTRNGALDGPVGNLPSYWLSMHLSRLSSVCGRQEVSPM